MGASFTSDQCLREGGVLTKRKWEHRDQFFLDEFPETYTSESVGEGRGVAAPCDTILPEGGGGGTVWRRWPGRHRNGEPQSVSRRTSL